MSASESSSQFIVKPEDWSAWNQQLQSETERGLAIRKARFRHGAVTFPFFITTCGNGITTGNESAVPASVSFPIGRRAR